MSPAQYQALRPATALAQAQSGYLERAHRALTQEFCQVTRGPGERRAAAARGGLELHKAPSAPGIPRFLLNLPEPVAREAKKGPSGASGHLDCWRLLPDPGGSAIMVVSGKTLGG